MKFDDFCGFPLFASSDAGEVKVSVLLSDSICHRSFVVPWVSCECHPFGRCSLNGVIAIEIGQRRRRGGRGRKFRKGLQVALFFGCVKQIRQFSNLDLITRSLRRQFWGTANHQVTARNETLVRPSLAGDKTGLVHLSFRQEQVHGGSYNGESTSQTLTAVSVTGSILFVKETHIADHHSGKDKRRCLARGCGCYATSNGTIQLCDWFPQHLQTYLIRCCFCCREEESPFPAANSPGWVMDKTSSSRISATHVAADRTWPSKTIQKSSRVPYLFQLPTNFPECE